MKKRGARFQYAEDLERELLQAYKRERSRQLNLYGRINEPLLMLNISRMPVSRFYCSEERARQICEGLIAGETYPKMKPLRREMYIEILSRTLSLRKTSPDLSFYDAIIQVCASQAPSFYMTPGSIRGKLSTLHKKSR